MDLQLPDPDTARLPRSPLELVVFQIRFDNQGRVGDSSIALAFHEELGGASGSYPQLDVLEGQQLVVTGGLGIEAQAQARTSSGWRLSSESGDWVISLMPDHVSLETTKYTTWDEDFLPRLEAVIDATATHFEPVIEQRVGLRYVDRIEELGLDSILAWADYIVPELVGPIMHPQLGAAITGLGQQLVVRIDEQLRAAIRNGPITDRDDGRVDYLLDYDVFRQGGRAFDAADLITTASRLNKAAHQLFRASITDKLVDFLSTP